jgi:hypothetical protein
MRLTVHQNIKLTIEELELGSFVRLDDNNAIIKLLDDVEYANGDG